MAQFYFGSFPSEHYWFWNGYGCGGGPSDAYDGESYHYLAVGDVEQSECLFCCYYHSYIEDFVAATLGDGVEVIDPGSALDIDGDTCYDDLCYIDYYGEDCDAYQDYYDDYCVEGEPCYGFEYYCSEYDAISHCCACNGFRASERPVVEVEVEVEEEEEEQEQEEEEEEEEEDEE